MGLVLGLVHGFGQKLEISSLFLLRQNVLYNKLAFVDHKNTNLE